MQAGNIAKHPCWPNGWKSSCDSDDEWGNDKSSNWVRDDGTVIYVESMKLALCEMTSKSNMSAQYCVDGGGTIPVSVTNNEGEATVGAR